MMGTLMNEIYAQTSRQRNPSGLRRSAYFGGFVAMKLAPSARSRSACHVVPEHALNEKAG